MICDNCGIDRLVTDFINNQKFCYHCEYRIKLEKTPIKRTKDPNKCRICNKEIIHEENARKRQRNVFCSQECAAYGHKILSKNYWTRTIKNGNPYGLNFKNRSFT